MANDLNIRIKINSDTKQLEITQDGFEKIRQKSDEASGALGIFHGSLGKIAALAATGLGFAALSASVSDFISTAGRFEQYAVSLKVLSGSAQNAEKSLAWVKDFTAKTPYTLDQTMEAFIRLKAYGIDATDGSLKVLGDTASALGKPLMASVEAMADAMTGENERLKEFGITAKMQGDTIAYNWIDSSGQARTQIIENNKQIIKSTLEAIFNEKYAGMMDEQSKTWVGAVSNLEDSWTSLKDTIARDSGVFDSAKSAITNLNTLISNQSGELDTLKHYTMTASVAAGTFYGVTLLGTGITALKEIDLATKVATLSQIGFNTAVKLNPWVATAALIATAVAGLYEYKGLLDEIDASEAKMAGQSAFMKDLQFLSGKDKSQQLHDTVKRSQELKKEELSIIAELKKRSGYMYQGSKNDEIVDQLEKRRAVLREEQKALVDYSVKLKALKAIDGAPPKTTVVPPSTPPTDAELKKAEAERLKREKDAEALKQSYLSINKDITSLIGTDNDKAIASINEQAEKYRKAKIDELTIAKYVSAAKQDLLEKQTEEQNKLLADHFKSIGDDDAAYYMQLSSDIDVMVKKGIYSYDQINQYRIDKDQEYLEKKALAEMQADQESLKAQIDYLDQINQAQLDYYTATGNYSDAYYMQESEKIRKLAETGAYENEQLLSILAKDNEAFEKELFAKNQPFLSGLIGDTEKAMDGQLFDAMVGKWTSFGNWFKDYWSSLSTSVVRALSSQLSTSIIGGLKDLLLGSSSNGGIVNELKNYGGYAGIFGTVGTLTGTTMSANDYASVVEKYGSIAGMTVTPDGTTIDNTGKITSMGSGSDLASLLNTASSLKTAYTAITSGVSTMMATGTASIATGAYNLGLKSVGDFFAGGTTGLIGTESGFTAGSAGSYGATLVPIASAAILGGVGGYALGSLGDKLFGTDTKAGSYGAIGGSIGAVVGSVVPVIGTAVGAVVGSAIGSLIGGFQGKDWISGQGYLIDSANSSSIIGKRWAQTTASDWGDEDVTNYFAALTEKEKSTISQAILSFETMLVGIGSDVSIQLTKGLYSSLSDLVNKGVAKAFIDAATDADTALIYKEWKSYAKSLKVSVSEAISSAVSDYTTTTRSFETWNLERSGNSLEALKLKSQWASADTASLEKSLGISGVTIENYLDRYKTAIKESFDPETINNWKSLGEQLMNNTEAADAYTNALKEQAAVSAKLRPQDMMLSRVGDATSITGTSEGTVLKDMLSTFNKLIRAIETQTKINELAAGR